MRVLLSVIDRHDPFIPGLIEKEDHLGPLLSWLQRLPIDKLLLVGYDDSNDRLTSIIETVKDRHSALEVEVVQLGDRPASLRTMAGDLAESPFLLNLKDFDRDSLYLSLGSGDVTLSTQLFKFVLEGELNAQILPITLSEMEGSHRVLWDALRGVGAHYVLRSQISSCEDHAAEETGIFLDDLCQELGLVGSHPQFKRALQTTETLAFHSQPVLFSGPPGAGKELFARLLFYLGDRRSKSLVTVNCASLNENLAETVLFGERDRLGGKTAAYQGKLQMAEGGCLLLLGIDELPLQTQARLFDYLNPPLRQHKDATVEALLDVRLIATAHRELSERVAVKQFREDLYSKLRVGEIQVPSLADRASDVPKLALHMLNQVNMTLKNPKRLSRDSLEVLEKMQWPNNLHDLRAVIERTALLCPGLIIRPEDLRAVGGGLEHLPKQSAPLPAIVEGFSLEKYLSELRRRIILKALDKAGGNQSEAARMLKLSPQAVHQFLKQQKKQS